jgi:hypothetical protein
MPIFTEPAQLPGATGHALLLCSAVVAGAGLLRPWSGPPGRLTGRIVWLAAGSAALSGAVGLIAFTPNLLVVAAHLLAVLGAAWLLPRRVLGLCGGILLTALLVLETAINPSIVDLPVAPVYLVAGVLVLGAGVATWTVPVRRVAPVLLVAVVTAAGFGVADTLVPHRDHVTAGVPLLTAAHTSAGHVPVLVTPGRPGLNLVYVAGSDAVPVGSDPGHALPAAERPGAGGRWATVDLPPGVSRLWISGTPVDVDTGHGPRSTPVFTGPDGPECASAALGAVLAGSRQALTGCPADALAPADAETLRALMKQLAGRGVPEVRVEADASARSAAALSVLRDAAREAGLTITGTPARDGALIVVSGWAAATSTLRAVATRQLTEVLYSTGTYLAPWLLSAPVLRSTNGTVLALRFDPRDEPAVRYQVAVEAAFHGSAPTESGYHAWLTAQNSPEPRETRLYAASAVAFLPQEFAHHTHETGWLPGGTIVPVTGPLT